MEWLSNPTGTVPNELRSGGALYMFAPTRTDQSSRRIAEPQWQFVTADKKWDEVGLIEGETLLELQRGSFRLFEILFLACEWQADPVVWFGISNDALVDRANFIKAARNALD